MPLMWPHFVETSKTIISQIAIQNHNFFYFLHLCLMILSLDFFCQSLVLQGGLGQKTHSLERGIHIYVAALLVGF